MQIILYLYTQNEPKIKELKIVKNPLDVQAIYNSHLLEISKERKAELDKTRPTDISYYRPSSAGMCSRKIYYETVLRATVTDEISIKTRRLFRLGTILHDDIQSAFKKIEKSDSFFSIYNIYINNILIEKEIVLKKIRVRGFFDLLVEVKEGGIFLYDIKSVASFPYNKKFARKKEQREPSLHHELQLATYGLWVKKEYGRLDGMYILYYNKDNSLLRWKEVSSDRLLTALGFWERINDEHSKSSLPTLQDGISPIYRWECSYCNFKSKCNYDRERGL